MTDSRVQFFERRFPSANMVLVRGSSPVLVDTGFGSDLPETERLITEAGVKPQHLRLIVNTHYHSDHVGGNSGLQGHYDLPIAAHRWEAAMVNQRDPESCSARWLVQPVEPYRVDQPLADGDEISYGNGVMKVIHTPGHSLGHISLYLPQDQILICGDALHGDDVSWVNPFREGAGAVQRMLDSLDRLAALPVTWACSGHGAPMHDFPAALSAARRRYERFLADPEKAGWHACKRIFAYALMLEHGLMEQAVRPYLLAAPWFQDYSRYVFGLEPEAFIDPLLAEMIRSGAADWRDGKLVALTAHTPPPPGWAKGPVHPAAWPK